jgi:glycosyltransferase involved in cell wall biosynthesis
MGTLSAISVCIPFYSGREYLCRAIDSVLRQAFTDWELVVSEDHGPDADVEALVLSYREPRIRYARNESNLGMAGNWNRCLELASSELVTLLHADDELLPDYCGQMVRAAAEHGEAAALCCRAMIIGEDGTEQFSFPDFFKNFLVPVRGRHFVLQGEPALQAILRGNFIMCPTLCFRMSRLRARRFSTHWEFVQDMDLLVRLFLEGETVIGLPDVSYAYRRHAGSATVAYTNDLSRFEEESILYDVIRTAALARGWRRAARVAEGKWIIKMNLAYRAVQDMCRLRPGQALRKAVCLASMLSARGNSGRSKP